MTAEAAPAPAVEPVLRAVDVTKRFGGLTALDQVSIQVAAGEVLGLVGDNGAGKSTLIQCISGVYRPDAGQVFLEGREVTFASPMEGRRMGIETIYQDLALCENLDAADNIFLGREPATRALGVLPALDRATVRREARQVLDQLNIHIPAPERPIRQMSGGQRQAVAIARAVYWNAKLMIMDEPTAALGVPEQRKVLALVRTLRERGVPVILISHNLLDVFAVADRIVVLRRGRMVGDLATARTDTNEVVSLMVGGPVSAD